MCVGVCACVCACVRSFKCSLPTGAREACALAETRARLYGGDSPPEQIGLVIQISDPDSAHNCSGTVSGSHCINWYRRSNCGRQSCTFLPISGIYNASAHPLTFRESPKRLPYLSFFMYFFLIVLSIMSFFFCKTPPNTAANVLLHLAAAALND